jgi:hypothetical protein
LGGFYVLFYHPHWFTKALDFSGLLILNIYPIRKSCFCCFRADFVHGWGKVREIRSRTDDMRRKKKKVMESHFNVTQMHAVRLCFVSQ